MVICAQVFFFEKLKILVKNSEKQNTLMVKFHMTLI